VNWKRIISEGILWIIMIAIIIGIFNMGGCAAKKFSDLDVLWHDGECVFHAKGLSLEQANNMMKDFEFGPCEVKVFEQSGGKTPPKH